MGSGGSGQQQFARRVSSPSTPATCKRAEEEGGFAGAGGSLSVSSSTSASLVSLCSRCCQYSVSFTITLCGRKLSEPTAARISLKESKCSSLHSQSSRSSLTPSRSRDVV